MLAYFSEVTDIIEAELRPTICKVIPIKISIENALLSYQPKIPISTTFKETILRSLQSRFKNLHNDQLFITTLILDPSIKLSFCKPPLNYESRFVYDEAFCKNIFQTYMLSISKDKNINETHSEHSQAVSNSTVDILQIVETTKSKLPSNTLSVELGKKFL